MSSRQLISRRKPTRLYSPEIVENAIRLSAFSKFYTWIDFTVRWEGDRIGYASVEFNRSSCVARMRRFYPVELAPYTPAFAPHSGEGNGIGTLVHAMISTAMIQTGVTDNWRVQHNYSSADMVLFLRRLGLPAESGTVMQFPASEYIARSLVAARTAGFDATKWHPIDMPVVPRITL